MGSVTGFVVVAVALVVGSCDSASEGPAAIDPPGAPDELVRGMREQTARLHRARFEVYSARIHDGPWPADLPRPDGGSTICFVVDVELTGYGVRIDPDDYLLVTGTGPNRRIVAANPYCERLTHDGRPVDWQDPAITGDPDLRMRAYFAVPEAERGTSVRIEYDDKPTGPFVIR